MNKYKKRIIQTWKVHGHLTLCFIEEYNIKKDICDLKTACYWYIKYVEFYLLF